jgi:uncharacterized protein with NRDE domain
MATQLTTMTAELAVAGWQLAGDGVAMSRVRDFSLSRQLPTVNCQRYSSAMCLIVLAHRVHPRFPLVLAANRDEDYERATRDAHWWNDAPHILGGRDALHGGAWLAITNGGRFAAVTNLRGAERKPRSRGALVRDFVMSGIVPTELADYSGFHLLAGQAGEEILHITPNASAPLAPGIHAISNAPLGEEWPKTRMAAEEMQSVLALDDAASMREQLMHLLTSPRGTARVESEIFIAGDRYGTRASTVILVGRDAISFDEQTFSRGGVPVRRYSLAFPIVGSSPGGEATSSGSGRSSRT